MRCSPLSSADPINEFAVVSYIPERLGDFITRLREELVDGCVARSHVSILPPRPLNVSPDQAQMELRNRSSVFEAFEIDIPRLRIFEATSVIFADVGRGSDCFFEMHDALNTGPFAWREPYAYHPHITLAQGFDPCTVAERYELAVRRWKEAPQSDVPIENLTFVRNTSVNRWVDLAEFELRGALAPLAK